MASLSELKKNLHTKNTPELVQICMRLAKFKRENKELIDYILNSASNESEFIEAKKTEITDLLNDVASHNYKNIIKILRKTLAITKKYIKYSGIAQTEIELLIHYCKRIQTENIKINHYAVMQNLYNKTVLKIEKEIHKLHPDLQFDYSTELEEIKKSYKIIFY